MKMIKYWWLQFIHKENMSIKDHHFYPQNNSNSERKKIFQFSVLHNNWLLNPKGFWTVTKFLIKWQVKHSLTPYLIKFLPTDRQHEIVWINNTYVITKTTVLFWVNNPILLIAAITSSIITTLFLIFLLNLLYIFYFYVLLFQNVLSVQTKLCLV